MANDFRLSRRRTLRAILQFAALANPLGGRLLALASSPFRLTTDVDLQPLRAQVGRVIDAMAYLGEPFSDADRALLDAASNMPDEARAVEEIQRVLDKRCLLGDSHQPREPSLGHARRRAGATRRTRVARVPREGAERGGRHRDARR